MFTVIYGTDKNLINNIRSYCDHQENAYITDFSDAEKCIAHMEKSNTEILFICLGETDEIPVRLREYTENNPVVTCIVGSSEDQAITAYRCGCDAFILKEDLEKQLPRKREDLILLSQRIRPLRLITFGSFEVLFKGRRMIFRSSKAKELLALCTDRRGQRISISEAADKLWSDRPYDDRVKVLYRKAVMNLRSLFREIGMEDFFITGKGWCCINTDMASCDYFDLIDAPEENAGLFKGIYMYDYSWAETTLAAVENTCRSISRKEK